jgi:hypothetical protein
METNCRAPYQLNCHSENSSFLFQAYTKDHMTNALSSNLFIYMQHCVPSLQVKALQMAKISEEILLVAIAHILKASPEQRAAVIRCLAQGSCMSRVTKPNMEKVCGPAFSSSNSVFVVCSSFVNF